jgi:hypothetical protein
MAVFCPKNRVFRGVVFTDKYTGVIAHVVDFARLAWKIPARKEGF